jgi:undecaprenyl diphosphate synthase
MAGAAGILDRLRLLRRSSQLARDEPALPEVARAVAIIMDGNGRWATRRGLPALAGHRAGTRALRRTVEAAIDLGVGSLTVYAFSTENWARPPDEVRGLLDLLGETIRREFQDLARQGVRVRFVGRRDRCSDGLRAAIIELERDTLENDRLDLFVCFDYGGRAELVDAARRLVSDGVAAADVDEDALRARLADPDLPDPDLVIRTSGEQRISNFLLWQVAYSELVFTDALWPDFGADDLRGALAEYAGRRRRFGGR